MAKVQFVTKSDKIPSSKQPSQPFSQGNIPKAAKLSVGTRVHNAISRKTVCAISPTDRSYLNAGSCYLLLVA
jgi:hypothetical protein